MGRGKHLPRSRPGPVENHKPSSLTRLVDRFDVNRANNIDRLASKIAVAHQTARYFKDVLKESNPKAAMALGVMATPSLVSVELADIPSEVETDTSGRIISIPAAERILSERNSNDFSPEAKRQYSEYRIEDKSQVSELPPTEIEKWQKNDDGSINFSLVAGRLPDGRRSTLSEIANRLFIPGGWQGLHENYNSHIQNPGLLISGIDKIKIHVEKPLSYEVKAGDTLSAIAARTGVFNFDQLAELNGIDDPDKIFVGQEIIIPFETNGWEPYTVQNGDTLGNIGFNLDGKDGVEADTIARMNLLDDADLIFTGSTLLLPKSSSAVIAVPKS